MKKILLITFFAAIVISAFAFYSKSNSQEQIFSVPVPTPTPTPQDTTTKSEVKSPDGTMKLTMQKTKSVDGAISYTFFVSGPEISRFEIYSKTLAKGEMSIPLNSWAPDNKYFFISENDGGADNYFIFKATGEAFADGAEYIDFMSHYSKKMTEYSLRDVTGWDAPGLLYVRTSGPAYWFEIPSYAFYRLVQR